MSVQDEMVQAAQRLLMNNYRQSPVVFSRGDGCLLWDIDGRRYLDMTAGIAVCVLGHADPGLADVISAQARQLIHASNLYYLENQIRFADALSRRAFRGRVFFCNSGTEANEAALKLARRYQIVTQKRPDRVELVAFENGFHGRTMGALSVTGQSKYRDGFGPLVGPVKFLPYGDIAAARAAITTSTCAVILEPIQAEGGILLPPPGYLQDLRRHCSDTGTVLIFDEVQTGSGRTGTFYAFEKEGVTPDVVTLAKGLAGGVPIGAMLANEEVARGFEPGTHAATFGGNPLATAGALYVQQAIDRENLLERCRDVGSYLGSALLRLAERRRPRTRGARGRGLLQGLVMDGDAAPVVAKARDAGLLISVAGGNVIRFAPALIVSKAQVDEAIAILDDVLAQVR
ncbi:MAG: acetylornithine/N-succinyldiaminopimelate aminotransferase [Myxococcales bacterium]|jgi:predicted acetylornithine/succinylornithine family transaminase|nr:acetylornithine/N-succinyldiaminopimelate aminotransferase [Myxococcales bacterium]